MSEISFESKIFLIVVNLIILATVIFLLLNERDSKMKKETIEKKKETIENT
jgi:large-conductance mechanosensitive channel